MKNKPRYAWWSDKYYIKTGCKFQRFLTSGQPAFVSAVTVDPDGQGFDWDDKVFLGEVKGVM